MPKVQKMKDAITRKCSLEPNEEQFQVISPHFQKLGRGKCAKNTKVAFFSNFPRNYSLEELHHFKKFLIVNKIKIKTKKLRN